MKHSLQQDLFRKGNTIQSKINSNTISKQDVASINNIDESIIIGTIKVEQSLKIIQASHPWSPILASIILQV